MIGQVTNEAIIWKEVAAVLGTLIPIFVLIYWKRKTKCSLKPVVVGAITFFVFSQVLEGIPKFFLFVNDSAVSNYVWTHAWAYVMAGCLLAGIFEETGRYIALRFVLKKYQNRRDSITYGIGHGGFEAILILGITGIVSIGLSASINNGTFVQSLNGVSGGQLKSSMLQADAIIGYGAIDMVLDVLERILAMALHIAFSIVVFHSVKSRKFLYLFLAISLHAAVDVPAALFQFGVLSRISEECLLVCGAIVCIVVARAVYQKECAD